MAPVIAALATGMALALVGCVIAFSGYRVRDDNQSCFARFCTEIASCLNGLCCLGWYRRHWQGIALFHEPVTIARLLSLALIFAGIVGLKLTSPQYLQW